MNEIDDAHPRKRGRPFEPGIGGNPNGRPPGSRNRKTIAAQQMLEENSEGIMRALIERALRGEQLPLRLCVERLYPTRMSPRVTFELPDKLDSAADVRHAGEMVLRACAEGAISPTDGRELMDMLSEYGKRIESFQLAEEVQTLKQQIASLQPKVENGLE